MTNPLVRDEAGAQTGDHVDRWLAPAKLNLFLHIVGRRDDGYHLLQTVFQLLDYGDELWFEVTRDSAIRMYSPLNGVPDSDNLIVQAARLLQIHCSVAAGAVIGLNKKLPMGGGLGGGSSDAATTLLALNRYWQTGLSRDELATLGLALGADVPVFVHGHSAWAEGVGEKLQPLDLPEAWYVVVNPGVHVSTQELFSHPQLTRDCPTITIRGFHSGVGLSNVFQPVVCEHYPQVLAALDALALAAKESDVRDANGEYRNSQMTGTGACVFLACDSENEAQNVLAALRATSQTAVYEAAFVAKGVNSPG